MRTGFFLVLAASAAIGCDSPAPTPPPTPDPGPTVPPGVERITGSERIGWSQQAANGEELSTFRYLMYVDSTAAELQDVSCSATAGPAGFACTARLPPMTAGQHALALAAYIDSAGARLESPRSTALNVLLVAQTTTAVSDDDPTLAAQTITTTDGVRLRLQVVVEGLEEPTDLAFARDGRILIAERAGRIRVVRGDRLVVKPAISLADVDSAGARGLLAIAVDPRDVESRFVYAVYTTPRGFRLARFRRVGDTLGDRAILLDDIPSSAAAAGLVRVGPDDRLYVGFDDGGDADRAGDLGSFNGKVLRLNPDATTPADQPGGSPVYAANVSAPRGAAWSASTTLWVVDGLPDSGGMLEAIVLGGRIASRYRLPEGARPSAIAAYQGDRIPELRGDVLVATPGDRSVLRLTLDANDPTRVVATERWRDDSFDGARALGVGPDGTIYVCGANSLVRLTPF